MDKILVYGMGSSAKNFLKNVSGMGYVFVGITDSYATGERGKKQKFEKIPIFCLEDSLKLDFDWIVVCSVYYKEIKRKIKEVFPNTEKVVNISEFYQKVVFKKYHEYLLQENDLYRFACNGKHTALSKWFHYFEIYDKYFKKFRNTDVVMCEIGICKGGSMQMWQDYFGKNATIIGIDVNDECRKYKKENIHIEIGSQDDRNFWNYFKKKYPRIDILLEDGGHTMEQQIITYESMFTHISDGGIYLCEDCHTSYWEKYQGGYKKDGTFIEYSKNWIDAINANYIEGYEMNPGYNKGHIAGLHYYDSMVIIEKNKTYSSFPINFES